MYVHVYSSVIAQGISCISPMYIYALSVCVGGGGICFYTYLYICMDFCTSFCMCLQIPTLKIYQCVCDFVCNDFCT